MSLVLLVRFENMFVLSKIFLQRLRAANLTIKHSKCFIGYSSIECLGHIAGNEELRPLFCYGSTTDRSYQEGSIKQGGVGRSTGERRFEENMTIIAMVGNMQ